MKELLVTILFMVGASALQAQILPYQNRHLPPNNVPTTCWDG